MPPKPEHELTVIEIQVLNAASRFLAAAAKFSVTPPRPEEEEYISGKVAEELASINTVYKRFEPVEPVDPENPKKSPKLPRAHPIIQLIGNEWKRAYEANRMPDWSIFTKEYITLYCTAQKRAQPGWNADLASVDLSHYVAGQPRKKLWWVDTPVLSQGYMEIDDDEAPPPQLAPSPSQLEPPPSQLAPPPSQLAPPPSQQAPHFSTADKGKTRAPPAARSAVNEAQPPAHSYGLRGRKRSADDSVQDAPPADLNAMVEDTETTPRKADGPADKSVPRVTIDSPPPTRRARTDVVPLKARGDVNIKRLTVACQRCADKKKECSPGALWAQPIRDLMVSKGIDVRAASLELELQARIDIIEAKIDYLVLVMNGMADNQGVIPSTLQGYFPPPPPRSSPTPSIQSLPTRSSLSVADSHSNPSTRSSSLSERQSTSQRRSPRGASSSSRSRGRSAGGSKESSTHRT